MLLKPFRKAVKSFFNVTEQCIPIERFFIISAVYVVCCIFYIGAWDALIGNELTIRGESRFAIIDDSMAKSVVIYFAILIYEFILHVSNIEGERND